MEHYSQYTLPGTDSLVSLGNRGKQGTTKVQLPFMAEATCIVKPNCTCLGFVRGSHHGDFQGTGAMLEWLKLDLPFVASKPARQAYIVSGHKC